MHNKSTDLPYESLIDMKDLFHKNNVTRNSETLMSHNTTQSFSHGLYFARICNPGTPTCSNRSTITKSPLHLISSRLRQLEYRIITSQFNQIGYPNWISQIIRNILNVLKACKRGNSNLA